MSGPEPLIAIQVGDLQFTARLERAGAPTTCDAFLRLLPLAGPLLQARWSGESAWIPLGDFKVGVGFENHTSHPAPGHIILYPGGISETEILLAYGGVSFASKVGQLAGNHFLTITKGEENLEALGKLTLRKGAQDIVFARKGRRE